MDGVVLKPETFLHECGFNTFCISIYIEAFSSSLLTAVFCKSLTVCSVSVMFWTASAYHSDPSVSYVALCRMKRWKFKSATFFFSNLMKYFKFLKAYKVSRQPNHICVWGVLKGLRSTRSFSDRSLSFVEGQAFSGRLQTDGWKDIAIRKTLAVPSLWILNEIITLDFYLRLQLTSLLISLLIMNITFCAQSPGIRINKQTICECWCCLCFE